MNDANSDSEIEDTVKKKTLSIYFNKQSHVNNILFSLSSITKNIYNTTIYNTNIFYKYKEYMCKNAYTAYMNIDKKQDTDFYDALYSQFDFFYNMNSNKNSNYNTNSEFLYNYINEKYNIILNNKLFYAVENNIISETEKILKYDNDFEYKLIIRDILKNKYLHQYHNLLYKMKNKIPFGATEIIDENLLDDVRNNRCLFTYDVSFKKSIKLSKKIISDANIIKRFVYKHLGENVDKIPSDVICNTIIKATNAFASYFALKQKGKFARKPNYIKDKTYIVPYFCRSFVVDKEKNKVRLTVGKYIAKNYLSIVNNSNLFCINEKENTEYKKYVDYRALQNINGKKISKVRNYIFGDKYINKDNENIINSNYVNIDIPQKLNDKNIKMIEIVPLYDGYKYKVNFTYDSIETKEENTLDITENKIKCNPADALSIDLGMGNLMAIYDPSGFQIIIKGKHIMSKNGYYTEQIKTRQSKIDLEKNKKNEKDNVKIEKLQREIYDLWIKRKNVIDDFFNKIVKFLEIKYKTKKIIIVGYNLNWKTCVNMGSKMNDKFYKIPYCSLLKKMKDKFGTKLIFTEESYTSKCDALSLEEVGRKVKYSGKRIKRGLFESKNGTLINADLNGAINIMRKRIEMTEIEGKNIMNPVTIKIITGRLIKLSRDVELRNQRVKGKW